jgi:hypothetical protein
LLAKVLRRYCEIDVHRLIAQIRSGLVSEAIGDRAQHLERNQTTPQGRQIVPTATYSLSENGKELLRASNRLSVFG